MFLKNVLESLINEVARHRPFLFLPKTSENLTDLLCFQGIEKGCKACIFIKKTFLPNFFPGNITSFLRTVFLQNTPGSYFSTEIVSALFPVAGIIF